MRWTELHFGKHIDKSLPQVLWKDPDCFFWAVEDGVLETRGFNMSEVDDLYRKAKNIRVPKNEDGSIVVEYFIHAPTRKFSHFDIVQSNKPEHVGSSPAFRSDRIDMSVPRQIASYDKLGCTQLVKSLKLYLFGDKSTKMTKKRCEEFFEDPENFA